MPDLPKRIVGGPVAVPHHMGDHRRAVIGNDDDVEPVSEREMRDLRRSEREADIVCPLSLEEPAATRRPCGAIVTIPRHIGRRRVTR